MNGSGKKNYPCVNKQLSDKNRDNSLHVLENDLSALHTVHTARDDDDDRSAGLYKYAKWNRLQKLQELSF